MVDFRPKIVIQIICFLFILPVGLLTGCRDQPDATTAGLSDESQQCLSCHQVELDSSHRIDCLTCHLPGDDLTIYPEGHEAVLAAPAHPDQAHQTCGICHELEIDMVASNNHYLLADHIRVVTEAFGADPNLAADLPLTRISSQASPETGLQLVEDLLARRCLRCHVYSGGDEFSAVAHGTGCAACHLSFQDGRLSSHQFSAQPDDRRCLSCHYGNHVGYDYYGRYEHDLNEEFRTPYQAENSELRPYGVEYHNLKPDVHQQAGLVCTDCHRRDNIMGTEGSPACQDCHLYDANRTDSSISLQSEGNNLFFASSASGAKHRVPQLEHPAHKRYGNRFSCQACHAQWTFNDAPTHLLRIDHEEFYDFYKLSLDGSSEVLKVISSHILDDGDLLEPAMSNKFTGEDVVGIWFRGFGERRWEQVLLDKDDAGVVTTVRPIVDLRVSWIDEDEVSRFDNLEPVGGVKRSRPYAPHTIGKAGLFYEARIRPYLLQKEND